MHGERQCGQGRPSRRSTPCAPNPCLLSPWPRQRLLRLEVRATVQWSLGRCFAWQLLGFHRVRLASGFGASPSWLVLWHGVCPAKQRARSLRLCGSVHAELVPCQRQALERDLAVDHRLVLERSGHETASAFTVSSAGAPSLLEDQPQGFPVLPIHSAHGRACRTSRRDRDGPNTRLELKNPFEHYIGV